MTAPPASNCTKASPRPDGAPAPGLGQQTESRDSEYQRGRLIYRITARSQGGSGAVVRVTESTYSAIAIGNAGANPGATP